MNEDAVSDPTPGSSKHDWADADAMTEEERHAAALSDPDAQPMTAEQLARKPVPRTIIMRHALRLSQEDFASRFRIPMKTLMNWEQGRTEPDAVARAYLTVIARDPELVTDALASAPGARSWQ